MMENKIVAVSGGFDPIHSGHISYILDSAKHGPVVVILNSDEWLKRKKGFAFMPWHERASVVGAIKGVIDVIHADDDDGSVCESLKKLKPKYFAKGGDRLADNTPEVDLCNKIGIQMIFNCGGGKTNSSSEILGQYNDRIRNIAREWD